MGLNSGIGHLSRHGSAVQAQRVCYSTFGTGAYPPAWEYPAARQHDSFYTSMTLIDAVGGCELPAHLSHDPRVRD